VVTSQKPRLCYDVIVVEVQKQFPCVLQGVCLHAASDKGVQAVGA